MSNTFPTSYTDKTTLVNGDKVWGYDSEGISNVNFTLLSIYNYLTNNLSTSDVSEGTNLYYTDARVNTNSTVVDLGTNKADKTNVLELDNTTTYTPTTDYHPATKKYVDETPVPSATETNEGIIEIATGAEVKTGVNTTKAITPEGNKQKDIDNIGLSSSIILTVGNSGNIQATQNGFISCYVESANSGSYNISIFTDGTITPTTKVSGFGNISKGSCIYPVKKDDYYRIENDDPNDTTNEVYNFIPLG